jgi:HEAT repeat protein
MTVPLNQINNGTGKIRAEFTMQQLIVLYLCLAVAGLGGRKSDRIDPDMSEIVYQDKSLHDWIKDLKDPKVETRTAAASALGRIGADAKAAVPALIEALKDEMKDVRETVRHALSQIGPVAVPALIKALSHQDAYVCGGAAEALGFIQPEGRIAVPALLDRFKDEKVDVRRAAVNGLGRLAKWGWIRGEDTKAVVEACAEILKDTDWLIRISAADSLATLDPTRKNDAVVVFQKALKDKNHEHHFLAAAYLAEIDPAKGDAVPLLVEWLKGSAYLAEVARVLGNFGSTAQVAIPALTKHLQDKDGHVRVHVAEALVKIDPTRHKDVLPILVEALEDHDNRSPAAMTLGDIGSEAKAAVPKLREILKANLKEQQRTALEQPAHAGQEYGKMMERVKKDLARVSFLYALARIDNNKEAVPELVKELKNPDWMVRSHTIYALGKIGPAAKAAILALIQTLKEEKAVFRPNVANAARALGQIGPEAKVAVPILTELLNDDNLNVRKESAEALKRIRGKE